MIVKVGHSTEYTSNGCDCCEPTPWDVYHVGDQGFSNLEDVYEHLLGEVGITVEIEYEEED